MRYSYKSKADVAHLWAHQLQESAYCGNLYFEGDTIYSYGSHFPISRIVYNSRGEKAYIFNENTYSSSTSQHQNWVLGAIPHAATLFYTHGCLTPEVFEGTNACHNNAMKVVAQKISDIIDFMGKQRRARTVDHRSSIIDYCKFIRRWIAFWDLDKRQKWLPYRYYSKAAAKMRPTVFDFFTLPSRIDRAKYAEAFDCKEVEVDAIFSCFDLFNKAGFFTSEMLEFSAYSAIDDIIAEYFKIENDDAVKARNTQIQAAHKRRLRNERKIELRKSEKTLAEWHKNDARSWFPDFVFFEIYGWHTALRLSSSQDHQVIETSKGITINIEEGLRLWRIVKSFENGAQFRHDLALDINGTKWRLDRYENHILFAGCHAIHFSECERIAKQLNWA